MALRIGPQLASAPLEYYFLSPGQLLELQNGVYSICPLLSPSPSPRVQPKENKYPTACGCVANSARHGQIPGLDVCGLLISVVIVVHRPTVLGLLG